MVGTKGRVVRVPGVAEEDQRPIRIPGHADGRGRGFREDQREFADGPGARSEVGRADQIIPQFGHLIRDGGRGRGGRVGTDEGADAVRHGVSSEPARAGRGRAAGRIPPAASAPAFDG